MELEDLIAKRFPEGLCDERAFEEHFEILLDDVRGFATDLVEELETRLTEEATTMHAREGIERDHWWLFGDEEPVKSAGSARSKVARDLEAEEGERAAEGPRFTEEELDDLLFGLSDLARCRVICVLEQDLRHLQTELFDENEFLGRYRRRAIKDFVWDPRQRGGLRGHRALQFSVWAGVAPREFSFEVQLMTTLQHAWDRRAHPLYEQTREGAKLPDELVVNDFACSEALHLVDQQGARNWEAFLRWRETR